MILADVLEAIFDLFLYLDLTRKDRSHARNRRLARRVRR